ncbi:MAG: OsmC family protein [Hymenobacteraceae bacterium]|nr:OsmC family protein [Hymenobacteraceae bacterium]
MPTIETEYAGALRTLALHVASGNRIVTDAPTDNHGRGEAFSPSDLACAALGSCMLTIMGIKANQYALDITGTRVAITKEMTSNGPRRIRRITLDFTLPPAGATFSARDREVLERAAHTCPVALSLHPDIEQVVRFGWER